MQTLRSKGKRLEDETASGENLPSTSTSNKQTTLKPTSKELLNHDNLQMNSDKEREIEEYKSTRDSIREFLKTNDFVLQEIGRKGSRKFINLMIKKLELLNDPTI